MIALRTATVVACLLSLLTASSPLRAPAEIEISEDGRRFRTPPKLSQSALDGLPIADPAMRRDKPDWRILDGRSQHAYPGQSVSVGLLGCPGCTTILGMLGGLYIDLGSGRALDRRFSWPPAPNPPRWNPGRKHSNRRSDSHRIPAARQRPNSAPVR